MRRITNGILRTTVPAAALLTVKGDAIAQGCAMCRTALGSADDPLARGFYHSILFMMSAPYVVAGSIGAWLVYRHVVASRQASQTPTSASEMPEEHPGPAHS